MIALERADLVRCDECDSQLPCLDSLGSEHAPGKRRSARLVDLDAAAVLDLDLDLGHLYRVRCEPVSSAWRR
jgi:hypothetical protein